MQKRSSPLCTVTSALQSFHVGRGHAARGGAQEAIREDSGPFLLSRVKPLSADPCANLISPSAPTQWLHQWEAGTPPGFPGKQPRALTRRASRPAEPLESRRTRLQPPRYSSSQSASWPFSAAPSCERESAPIPGSRPCVPPVALAPPDSHSLCCGWFFLPGVFAGHSERPQGERTSNGKSNSGAIRYLPPPVRPFVAPDQRQWRSAGLSRRQVSPATLRAASASTASIPARTRHWLAPVLSGHLHARLADRHCAGGKNMAGRTRRRIRQVSARSC
jgi:hypothetical protein